MTKRNVTTVENALTPQIYKDLHEVSHFKDYELEDIQTALDRDLFDVVVYDGTQAIGMARVVGDDRIVFFIKDVIVHPRYKSQGYGIMLMDSLLGYIANHACKGAYIGLMSTPGVESFYTQFGFVERPTEGLGSGMVMFYDE